MRNLTGWRLGFAVTVVLCSHVLAQNPATATPEAGAAQPTSAAAEAQTLHILAGRSVIINTQARLKRILVSNPAVVDTTTVTPTQLVITAKAPGTASLVLWDETGRARILDVNSNVDVSELRDALQQAYPNEDLQVEADQGRIVITGKASTQAVADGAVKLAGSYSAAVVNSLVVAPPERPKQIMLKVRFAEIDRSKAQQLGMNIFSLGAANTVGRVTTGQFFPPGVTATGTAPPTATFSDLLNLFIWRPDINLGATIRALEAHNVLQILAEPNLLARSGEPASFIAGGEFPYPVVQGSGGGGAGGGLLAVTIQFRPYGVKLDFTGTVNPDNTIKLKVAPEVSTLDYTNALSFQGYVIPAISTRRAETVVDLKDGQSFGIAGLLDNRTTVQMSKIPWIGDVPILGALFRSKDVSKSHTELVVIVTPIIVDPATAPAAGPQDPKMPIDNLDEKKFDHSVGGKSPAAGSQKQQ